MAAGAGLWLAMLVATTQKPEQQIAWEAVAGCPSQAAVVEATHAFLGRPLADYPRALRVRARVEEAPVGFHLQLSVEVDGRREQHQLGAPDCDQLGRAAALLIAGAVDPFARGPQPANERQLLVTPVVVQRPSVRPTRSSDPPRPPVTPSPIAREPVRLEFDLAVDRPEPREPRARRPIAGTLAVAGTGFAGLFPQIGGGVSVDGGLERGLFRWQVGAAGWFGGQYRAANADVGADLWAATGTTGFCVAPGLRRVVFAACGVAGIGAITATSVNTQTQRTSARPWAYAGADLRVAWVPRPRLGLFFGVSVLPALARPGWTISNPTDSYRIPAVAGQLRLGVELRGLIR